MQLALYFFLLVDLTLESTKNKPQIELVQVHLRWEDHKLVRDQVFMVGGWKVHSNTIIPTLQLVWTLLASILCWGWYTNVFMVTSSVYKTVSHLKIEKCIVFQSKHLFCINKVPQNGQIIWLRPNLFFPPSEYLCRYEPLSLTFYFPEPPNLRYNK